MKSNALRLVVPCALAAFLVGCSGETSDGQPPVIDTSAAPPPTTSESASSGIPSSGGAVKKKPDPVGALSPIIPK
ncbi:hypothetical protein [Paludisphaera sp.]|uniref:hypothetical protein n=1 Tax=Paludisphaera sp. TaxID=2017432 RepID=UPI00301DF20F